MNDQRALSNVHIAVIAMTVVAGGASLAGFIRTAPAFLPDFAVFWTAARLRDVYDAQALTAAQLWLLPPDPGLRPFAYPPSALLFLKPLTWLSYSPAVVLWTALGMAGFAAACTLYGRRGPLALLGPMFGLTIITGQTSLFLGAMLAAGVALVKDRPRIAGILFGLVAAIKPQLALLVPLALVSARQWTALATAVAAGGLAVVASLAFGPHLWLDWFHSLAGFSQQVLGANFRTMNVGKGVAFAPLGLLCAGYVWVSSERPELRLAALVGSTALCLPYMLNYDLVAMAPAGAVLLLGRDWREWIVGFFAFVVLWLSPFVVAFGAAVLAYRGAILTPSPAVPAALNIQ